MTKREQILQVILTKLKSAGFMPATKIARTRIDPVSSKNYPFLNIEPVSDTPDFSVLGAKSWSLIIRLNLTVAGENPDSSADNLIESIHQTIMSDETVSGLAYYLEPKEILFEFDSFEKPIVQVSIGFEIKYRY